MRERWLPVGLLAGALFLINVLSRVVAKLFAAHNDNRQTIFGMVALGVIAAVMIGAGVWWIRRYPAPRAWGDLIQAIGAGCLVSVLIGPLLVGDLPFSGGAGLFFKQVWLFCGVTLAAAGFAALAVMTLGQDWKSQAWKRYATQVNAKPRKVVRR